LILYQTVSPIRIGLAPGHYTLEVEPLCRVKAITSPLLDREHLRHDPSGRRHKPGQRPFPPASCWGLTGLQWPLWIGRVLASSPGCTEHGKDLADAALPLLRACVSRGCWQVRLERLLRSSPEY
jgi:hypothetical protein